ncbi:hypothetical protein ACM26V_17145 [Salipaludibacillus sp. HK11]|uniref:hypothetical protein n=1 Tax=Salipaludibacillus sp. HK11 TaxID=3394320 RepID=UPI0039FD7847
MSDDFKKEEKVERREEPSRVGATLIKYAFITVLTLIILFFIVNYLIPLFPDGNGGGGEGNGNNGDSTINVEIDSDANSEGNDGGNNAGNEEEN